MKPRTTIGGPLDYRLMADLYKPSTKGGIRLAVAELLRQRLKARDVAAALRIDLAEVLGVMRDLEESRGQ